MTRLQLSTDARLHLLVWQQHPSIDGDPGWRVALAVNGCPVEFGERYYTGNAALAAALERLKASR